MPRALSRVARARAEEDHRQVAEPLRAPDRLGQREAVHAGHLDVADQQVGPLLLEEPPAGLAVDGGGDLVAGGLQDALFQGPGGDRVVDDEQALLESAPPGVGGATRRQARVSAQRRVQQVLAAFRTRAIRPVGRIVAPEKFRSRRTRCAQALDHDLLLGDQLVDDERHPPVAGATIRPGRFAVSAGRLGRRPGPARRTGGRPATASRPGPSISRPSTGRRSPGSTRTSFWTLVLARAKDCPEARTSRARSVVRVSGTASVNRVPWPGSETMPIVPCKPSTRLLTTSRPTPRPEMLVMIGAVEKPGRKIRSTGRARRPARRARVWRPGGAEPSRSSPAPSSATTTSTCVPRSAADTVDPRRRGLARRAAAVGRLDAVVDGVADQVDQRVLQPFQHRPVELDVAPLDDQLDLLAAGLGQVADDPIQPLAGLGEREHPDPAHLVVEQTGRSGELAAVAGHGHGEALEVLLQLAEFLADPAECIDRRPGSAASRALAAGRQ